MLGSLVAVYGGSKTHKGTGKDGQSFSYTFVNLLGLDDKQDEVLIVTSSNDVDLSSLDRFKEYVFQVDITTQEKGKKVKIVGVSPFVARTVDKPTK